MVECIWEGCVVVTGLWLGLVVSDGLNALPQAPCISAVNVDKTKFSLKC